jgi:2-polyprenyl-3-methyl-5-hydroxy-6-metoxy-1,4-benzoquinol methylase
LDNQSHPVKQIAARLHADERALRICLRILLSSDLIQFEATPESFRITSSGLALADKLALLKLEWEKRLNYAHVLDALKTGKSVMPTTGGVTEQDHRQARLFLWDMYQQSKPDTVRAAQIVAQLWQKKHAQDSVFAPKILDLGGGHGRYSQAFAAALPDAQVTLFDKGMVVEIARELAGTSFQTRAGDFLKDDLADEYDIIFIAGVISGLSNADVRQLFERVRQFLKPDGTVIIQDVHLAPASFEPAWAIDFQLTFLLENEGGHFRSVEEITELLRGTGLRFQSHIHSKGSDFSYIIATP